VNAAKEQNNYQERSQQMNILLDILEKVVLSPNSVKSATEKEGSRKHGLGEAHVDESPHLPPHGAG